MSLLFVCVHLEVVQGGKGARYGCGLASAAADGLGLKHLNTSPGGLGGFLPPGRFHFQL